MTAVDDVRDRRAEHESPDAPRRGQHPGQHDERRTEQAGGEASAGDVRQVPDGPDEGAARAQHARGKLTVRERLDLLLDAGSFQELEPLRRHRATGFGMEDERPRTDGVVTGHGTVEGRPVFVRAHDVRCLGGSLGEAHAAKIHRLMDLALSAGAPLVDISDGGAARIQEGGTALAGYGGVFRRQVRSSGMIPQISVVLGACAGGAAYAPALSDFVFMVRGVSRMYVTGPETVRTLTGEDVTAEGLGGAHVHGETSGVAQFVHDDEESCLADVRRLLSLLPANNRALPPREVPDDAPGRRSPRLLDLVPADPRLPYDMRAVIEELVDDGDWFEVHAPWAANVICALARLDGDVVGLVANQPSVLAGSLDIHAAEKAARFVQTCDAFNIPLVTLVDVPGFLPGSAQERGGILRHGAKLLYAYCNATVPRVSVILRKAYGGGYIVMDSQSIGADVTLAWPYNEIAVTGAGGAVDVVCREEIEEAADPAATRAECAKRYEEELMHPCHAGERGLVDDVIDPAGTRAALIDALEMLRTKHAGLPDRKHGNPPL
ncbi:acetyl-CoA carboxylase carboxyltransferase component [Streptomyces sp. Amel2xB2]|uniref:acyl-CoA carboxylase subunit beta n=1 Tax=Streptomyces sp. Amel2xB2 TaxID=1305829 RepID=UPI000DB9E70E|nr:acyl-CoA carboxylase subunit beta [Streptomyces sp. Amel2xB2]RAJ55389.1 acetyl-CoA carboxylase carboxyltransferase component [Streptomyces sp. Amel2xB2]